MNKNHNRMLGGIVAVILIAILLIVFTKSKDPGVVQTGIVSDHSSTPASLEVSDSEAENPSSPPSPKVTDPEPPPVPDKPPAAPLQLKASLVLHDIDPSELDFAFFGVTAISQEDRAEYQEWVASGRQGAGPESILDMANVTEWKPASPNVSELDNNRLPIGPIEVMRAPRYEIVAVTKDRLYFYTESFNPPTEIPEDGIMDAGDIYPTSSTGVALHFTGENKSELLARFDRVGPRQVANARNIQWVQELSNPTLYDTLRGDTDYLIQPDSVTVIAPLIPDEEFALRLTSLTGVRADPINIHLAEGQIVDHWIDLDKIFEGKEENFREFRGRLVRIDNEEPIIGTQVFTSTSERSHGKFLDESNDNRNPDPMGILGSGNGLSSATTDEDGYFFFQYVPDQPQITFTVHTNLGKSKADRPIMKSKHNLVYSLTEGDEDKTFLEHEWKLPVYKWLIYKLPNDPPAMKFPYPVFMLQPQFGSHFSFPLAADEFIQTPGEVAISLEEPFAGRAVMLVSPLRAIYSQFTSFSEKDSEKTVYTDEGLSKFFETITFKLEDPEGNPCRNAPVSILANIGQPEPYLSRTNQQGEVVLNDVMGRILIISTETNAGPLEQIVTINELVESEAVIVRMVSE